MWTDPNGDWRTLLDNHSEPRYFSPPMAHKPHQQNSGDDWAGLAQNLFGINLDKSVSGDDDLLDDDMFKVELPKPPQPPPVVEAAIAQLVASVAQANIEFAPAEPVAQAPARMTTVAASRPTKAAPPPRKAVVIASNADSFGAGVDDFGFGVVEAEAEAASDIEEEEDGLTLPDDYDAEGLTLPADYDDGLTLAPELIAEDGDDEDDEEFEDDDADADDEELSADEEFEDDEDSDEAADDEVAESVADAGDRTFQPCPQCDGRWKIADRGRHFLTMQPPGLRPGHRNRLSGLPCGRDGHHR